MSVRRNTTNRLTLIRACGTCGRTFSTTADSPWIRQIARGGKRQVTTYFCCSACFQASYKHIGWYDGKAAERRRAKDANRDPRKRAEAWKRWYAENGDAVRARRMERYYENREDELADNRFYRQKRKLLEAAE